MKNIVPGAIVFIVPTNRNWKESGTFLTTESCVELPVNLDKDTVVEIWQELGRDQCGGITSKRESYPPVKDKNPSTLDQPKLNAIYCNSSNLFACGIKLKANIEIEVTFQGNVTTYRTVASDSDCTDDSGCTDPNNAVPIPAPPQLSDGATVRIRQCECDNWSAWSNSESVQKVSAVATPVIVGDKLIPCQKLIEIENLDPPSGTLIIRSSIVGVIGQKPIKQEREFISLSPGLTGRDMSGNTEKIEVIHQACGQTNGVLKSVDDIETIAGSINMPLYDGDTSVTVLGATSGAYVELRDQNGFLDSGTAPFNPTGKTNMVFSHFGKLNKNQKIHLYFKYCGKEGENGEVQVVALPELISLAPNSVDQAILGTSPYVKLLVNGKNFVQGATIVWNNQQQLPTTFWSSNQLEATLSFDNLKTAGKIPVKVVNPDGTKSQKSLTFTINELDIIARLTISVGNGWDPPAPVIKSATFNVTTPLPLDKTESFSVPANSQGECVLDYNKSGYPQGTYTVKASVVMDPAGATPLPGPNPEPIKNWRWNTPTQVVIFTVDQDRNGPVINEH
ncbi:hypothetical protein CN936_28315 [Bacillus cereus]|uniref:hypothetical protein n=1 Tax=Bacillus cereus TaxID=1396 RepID=UPI000BFA5270|nr:hypothetical protein [Bacillus cereus]PFR62204.1 hypothetical protein COK29_27395 [Bacillus cereus]PGL89864.1 hypothetical protein CN936_28315 [Bacillus cereus]